MSPRSLPPLLAAIAATFATAAPAHGQTKDPATAFVGKGQDATYYTCTSYGGDEQACSRAPGRHPSAAAVAAYSRSAVHRALTLQYKLGNTVPFKDAPWVGTHNSFNSLAYGYTPARSDSNQKLTVTDQLRLDVRSLEIDVHWVDGEPMVCHGTEQHVGCTTEGPLRPVLDEIAAFLSAHPDQVILLYLEDQIGDPTGYDSVSTELARAFGAKLYRSAGGRCSPKLPLTLDRATVRRAGAQVVTVATGCGGGTETGGVTPWSTLVFDWSGDVRGETRPRGFQDFPSCGPDFERKRYDAQIIRYFEDSTFVTATASTAGAADRDDGITPRTAAAMTRCGVDLFGFDQLLPDDGRLEALVWSWAPGEPRRARRCVAQRRADARWGALRCGVRRRAACRRRDGRWLVTKRAVKFADARGACRKRGAAFVVPRTGHQNQLARQATPAFAEADSIWLAYRLKDGRWRAPRAR